MCNNYNEGILPNLVFGTSIFLFIAICETSIVCPNVSVKNGSSKAIFCQSDLDISDFYWYRGYPNSTPILILDSAGKGGDEYGSEHFDISSNGSMILRNVLVEHESYYSFIGFDRNGKLGRALFSVNVTISPDPPCPLIHRCNSCSECDFFDLKKAGTLTCEIKGARPLVPLVWKITSKIGIDFVKHHLNEKRDLKSDSWDTFVSLDYTIEDTCGVVGEVKCMAEDPSHILQSRISTVNIKTDPCKTASSADDDVVSLSLSIAVSLAALFVAGCLICLVCVYINCGRRSLLRGGLPESALMLLPIKEENVSILAGLLRRYYGKYCNLAPLPWDIYIPVADLYTECQCIVDDNEISSTNLIRRRGIILGKRVIVIGEHGSGRTTLTKYIVQQWVNDKNSTCLLIYVPLREVTKDMTLSHFVKNGVPQYASMDTEDIEKALFCGRIRCLVILDGHEYLSNTYKGRKTDGAEGTDEGDKSTLLERQTNSKVTVGDLLHGNLKEKYSNLHVWITSREADLSKTSSEGDIVVKMKGLSEKQLLQYIDKCVLYYSKKSTEERNLPEINDDDNIPISYWDNKVESIIKCAGSIQKGKQSINQLVVRFILQNDCLTDFQDTPLLLNITVHLMVGIFTSAIKYLNDKVIKNRNELMRNIIDCMEERYRQKKELHGKDFTILEQTVGEVAFKHSLKNNVEQEFWKRNIGEENFNTCLDIALLKRSQETSSKIEFYHPHIQDYLVAIYVVDKTDCFRRLLEEYTDDERYTVFIYLSTLLQDSQFQQLCETLHTCQKYDALIDCLLENGNYRTLLKVMENSLENHISISHLGSTYHRKAVWKFCKTCKELEIELTSLSFNPGDFLPFIIHLSLPKLGRVEFHQIIGVSKSDFQKICAWLSKQDLKIDIRFKECRLWKEIEQELSKMSRESSETEGNSAVSFHYSDVTHTWELEAYGTIV